MSNSTMEVTMSLIELSQKRRISRRDKEETPGMEMSTKNGAAERES